MCGQLRGSVAAMSTTLLNRIDERLEALGKSPEGASREAGLGRDFIRTLRRRPETSPRAENLAKLASVLACSVDYLLGVTDEPGEGPPLPLQPETMLPIRYEVAAGAWLATDEAVDEPLGVHRAQLVEGYERWPQWLERVRGDSYNRFIPDGALIHVVDAIAMGYEPAHEDVVVVVRTRAQGAFRERTVKQVVLAPEGIQLWPRSYNDKWSQPLDVGEDMNLENGDTVEIVAKVLRAYVSF